MKQLGNLFLAICIALGQPVFAAQVDAENLPSSPCPETLKSINGETDSRYDRLKIRMRNYFVHKELQGLTRQQACDDLDERYAEITEAVRTCPSGRCHDDPDTGLEDPIRHSNIDRRGIRDGIDYEPESKGLFSNSNLLWGLGGALAGGVLGYMAGKNNWFGGGDDNGYNGGYNPWMPGRGGPVWRPNWWQHRIGGNQFGQYPPGVLPMPGMFPGVNGSGWNGYNGMPIYNAGLGGLGGWNSGYNNGLGGWNGGLTGGAPMFIPGVGYTGGSPIYNGGNGGGYTNQLPIYNGVPPAVLPMPGTFGTI